MKYLRIICIALFLFFNFKILGLDNTRPISVNFHHAPLRSVLEYLSVKTQIKFVFYDDLVENRFVTCRFSSNALNNLLNRIILPQGLLYERTSTNVITLYYRCVPPHTWILQGQVFSGDSSFIHHAQVTIQPGQLATSTDSQGCFLFMDISLSPCTLMVTHPVFKPFQLIADSTQPFQSICLKRNPISPLQLQNSCPSIRFKLKMPDERYRPSEYYPVGSIYKNKWKTAQHILWQRYDSNSTGISEKEAGCLDFPSVAQIFYENIPVLKSDFLNGPLGGFHSFNIDTIQNEPNDINHFCKSIRLAAPMHSQSSTSFYLDPCQLKAKTHILPFQNLALFLSGRKTYCLNVFKDITKTYEDYQQLVRYQTIGPVNTPVHSGHDISSGITWGISKNDTINFKLIRSQDRLNTSLQYTDSLGTSESQMSVNSWFGIETHWQHQWQNNKTQIMYIHSMANEKWTYDHPRIDIHQSMDRDRVAVNLLRLSHEQVLNHFWRVFSCMEYASYNNQNVLKQNQTTLFVNKTYNHITSAILNSRFFSSILFQTDLGGEVTYLSEINRWMISPKMEFRYRLREPVVLKLSWARRPIYFQQIPNRIRTLLPKHTSLFRVLADSVYAPADLNDLNAQFIFRRNSVRITLDLFYHQYRKLLQVSPFDSQFNETEDFTWANAFQQGHAHAYGFKVISEFDLSRFHAWISYRLGKLQVRFPEFNDNLYYTPSWHRDHELEAVAQTKISGIYMICNTRLATGLPFVDVNPLYSITSFGPEYRMQMPSEVCNFQRSPVFMRVDFSFFRSFQLRRTSDFTIGISAINLFNHKNVIGPYYYIESGKPSTYLPQFYSQLSDLPRTAWFYIQFHFYGNFILPASED